MSRAGCSADAGTVFPRSFRGTAALPAYGCLRKGPPHASLLILFVTCAGQPQGRGLGWPARGPVSESRRPGVTPVSSDAWLAQAPSVGCGSITGHEEGAVRVRAVCLPCSALGLEDDAPADGRRDDRDQERALCPSSPEWLSPHGGSGMGADPEQARASSGGHSGPAQCLAGTVEAGPRPSELPRAAGPRGPSAPAAAHR